jgi:excisionase family DNA binding protein
MSSKATSGSNGHDPISTALAAAGADPQACVLTVEEAGAVLRISRGSAFAAVRSGDIPAVRIGRSWRVPRAALAAMVDEGESR